MAAFSRKHYVVLRDALIRARMHTPAFAYPEQAVDQVALELAVALAKDNRKFDRDKFLAEIRGYRSPALSPKWTPNSRCAAPRCHNLKFRGTEYCDIHQPLVGEGGV